MKYSRNDIEDRLKNLIDESDSKQNKTCTSIQAKIVSIVGFLFFAVGVSLAIYTWVTWDTNSKNFNEVEKKFKENNITLGKEKIEYDRLTGALSEYKSEEEKLKIRIQDLTGNITDLKNEATETKEKIVKIKGELEGQTKECDELKAKHEELKHINGDLTKIFEALEKKMKELTAALNSKHNSMLTFKIISGIATFLTVVTASFDVYYHIKVSEIRLDALRAEQYAIDYNKPAAGFEKYLFYSRHLGKQVNTKTCFNNGGKADLQACASKAPTLVTVNTYSGYSFAVYIAIPWPTTEGNHNDANSFVISANNGDSAPIQANFAANALTLKKDTLLEFGNNEIIISLDGKTGIAKASAYNVPNHFTPDNFLSGNTAKFDIADIKIEEITIS